MLGRGPARLQTVQIIVVCANHGINSDDYSFGYVTNWAGGGDEARDAIKASGARIQRAADQILTAMSGEGLEEVA